MSVVPLQVSVKAATVTVKVVSSGIADVVPSALPAASVRTAPALIFSWSVPTLVGVTPTLNTPGEVSVIEPTVIVELPALPKSAASTVLASMSSLKVTV